MYVKSKVKSFYILLIGMKYCKKIIPIHSFYHGLSPIICEQILETKDTYPPQG